MAKKSKEEWKTYGNVFDNHSRLLLHKLESQGHFDEILGTVSIGKEANIFDGRKGNSKIIIKIYRLENCDFNKMYDYIKYDPRYIGLRKHRRKIIFAWTQREFRNLMIAREHITTPMPLIAKDNIILLEYIGNADMDNGEIARKLKDDLPKDPDKFYKKTILYMKKLYKEAELVHGDLSEFNILNLNETPVFIDFSQSLPSNAPNADELLDRDIKNIARFFKKQGVDTSEEKILQYILK